MADDPAPTDGTPAARRHLGRVGFEVASDAYERARPTYPAPALTAIAERAGLTAGTPVLDLGAGTGKLTRQLAVLGARCVAVEPSVAMGEVFRRSVPEVPLVAGTAEAIPLASGSMALVAVAQAFHWFDAPAALAEIARVLGPGGTLALIWNERDQSDPLMAELVRISRWDRCQPYPVGRDFGPDVDASGRFGPVTRTRFGFVQQVDRQGLVDQVASRSYVQVLGEPERQAFLGRIADFAAALDEPIALPHHTDLFLATAAD